MPPHLQTSPNAHLHTLSKKGRGGSLPRVRGRSRRECSDIRACCWLEVGAQNRLRRDAGFERVQRAQNSLVSTPTTKSSCLSDVAKAPVSHGVEPHDLATGPGLRVPLSAHRPPPRTRRPYRASGLVFTSTPDGYGASRLRRLQPVRMGKERCSPTACQTAQISRNGARRGHADVYLAFATASNSLDRIELCAEDHHSPRAKTFSRSTPSSRIPSLAIIRRDA